jgi:hypothetical protein
MRTRQPLFLPFRPAFCQPLTRILPAFLQEMAMMEYVSRDANITQFYGVVFRDDAMLLVTEFLEVGGLALLPFLLRTSTPQAPLGLRVHLQVSGFSLCDREETCGRPSLEAKCSGTVGERASCWMS